MKIFKKSYTMLLTLFLLLVVGCLPQTVNAAESDFVVDANGVLTKYNGSGGHVVIPSEVNGVRVTSIGTWAFSGIHLTSISIPKSVTSIGNGAFSSCPKLESVYIYNKDILIDPTEPICDTDNAFVTLYGYKDSTTEAYAKKWNYKFKPLPDDSEKPLIRISLNKPTVTLDIGKSSLLSVIYNPIDTTDNLAVT